MNYDYPIQVMQRKIAEIDKTLSYVPAGIDREIIKDKKKQLENVIFMIENFYITIDTLLKTT